MAGAALLSVTLVPVLMILFIRGQHHAGGEEPGEPLPDLDLPAGDRVGDAMEEDDDRPCRRRAGRRACIRRRELGTEFMPTLNEGTLLYMPASLPGMSVTKAAELLQTQDKIIRSFPEVASVYGKAGRAQTATDPAPLEMFETVINLKPESEWRARA